jgi:tRNA (guanine-N7-)-methyltransferase
MREVLSASPTLQTQSTTPDGFAPRPTYRPLTRFESRGLRLGHEVFDLVYERRKGL